MKCSKVGCDHLAKFRIGDETADGGYNACGRHVAYYAEHMSGFSPYEWVPIHRVAKS